MTRTGRISLSNSPLQDTYVRIYLLENHSTLPVKNSSDLQNLYLTVRCFQACPPGRCGKPRLFQTSSMISFSSLPQTSVIVTWVCLYRLLPRLDRNGTSPVQNLFIQRIFNFSAQCSTQPMPKQERTTNQHNAHK